MSSKSRTLLLNRKRAYREQHGRCFWCDIQMLRPHDKAYWDDANQHRRWSAEHLIPQSKTRDAGRHAWFNIVAACQRCNCARGNKPIDQWVSVLIGRINEAQLALLLSKLSRFGIKLPIGHPALAGPTIANPIVRDPEEMSPAPA